MAAPAGTWPRQAMDEDAMAIEAFPAERWLSPQYGRLQNHTEICTERSRGAPELLTSQLGSRKGSRQVHVGAGIAEVESTDKLPGKESRRSNARNKNGHQERLEKGRTAIEEETEKTGNPGIQALRERTEERQPCQGNQGQTSTDATTLEPSHGFRQVPFWALLTSRLGSGKDSRQVHGGTGVAEMEYPDKLPGKGIWTKYFKEEKQTSGAVGEGKGHQREEETEEAGNPRIQVLREQTEERQPSLGNQVRHPQMPRLRSRVVASGKSRLAVCGTGGGGK
ncbi:hypothetical protein NDU88_001536 [Pleurodeles waltl]|uniref:Uncharacterized protein n=1 Tax=Pleurodeles waltl TaxID=8319 RepID=A0AAV7NFF6_PLEWA|nr:hypothetical protein NDU88_001536 [Pleurodeles waltl]